MKRQCYLPDSESWATIEIHDPELPTPSARVPMGREPTHKKAQAHFDALARNDRRNRAMGVERRMERLGYPNRRKATDSDQVA